MRFLLAVLVWLSAATFAVAHEVRPAIGDLTSGEGAVKLSIALGSAEPILAGVNLEGVADTNDTGRADEIDALRALPPEQIAARMLALSDDFLAPLIVLADGAPVALRMSHAETDDEPNLDLPRETRVFLEGDLPAGARSVDVSWPAEYGTLVLRQIDVEDGFTGYLSGNSSGPIQLAGGDAQSGLGAFVSFIPVGFDHILPKGLDHILFVLALFFLSSRMSTLLWQVTSFTIAHSVTLAMGALGVFAINPAVVEPIIAASIVFVALENVFSDKLSRWRPFVIFAFGLLHGMGFALVLTEWGLPDGQFIPALIGFNIGVEVGQLTVIAIAFLIVYLALRVDAMEADIRTGQVVYGVAALVFFGLGFALDGPGFEMVMGAGAPIFMWPLAGLCLLCLLACSRVDQLEAYRKFVSIPASCAIALVGAYWVVERVFL